MAKRWVYFFADGNVRRGPFSLEQLRRFPLRAETMVWREGMPAWSTLRDVPELWAIFAEHLVAPSGPTPAPAVVFTTEIPGLAPPQTPFFPEHWIDPSQSDASADPRPLGRFAVVSLVAGAGGTLWWCLPGSLVVSIPLSVIAIVCGWVGRRQIRRRVARGSTLAGGGLMLGIVNLVIAAGILVVLGVVVTSESRQPPPPATAPAGAR